MKKVLKSFFALAMCIAIIGNCVSVSAASRSNTYMSTSCTLKAASITVKSDFNVESMYAEMNINLINLSNGNFKPDFTSKTTKRTRSCTLRYTPNSQYSIYSVGYEGRIEGSTVGGWTLYSS
jgi:hypothetical protein